MKLIKLIKHISIGTYSGWFQQLCTAFSALLVLPIITHHLGQSIAGVWLALQAMVSIMGLADFGFGFVTSRQVAFALGGAGKAESVHVGSDINRDNVGWEGIAKTMRLAAYLNKISCGVGVIILLIMWLYVKRNQNFKFVSSADLAIIWFSLAFAIIVRFLAKPSYAVLEGVGKFHVTRFIVGSQQLGTALGCAIIAIFGGGLVHMSILMLVFSVFEVFIVYCWLNSISELVQWRHVGVDRGGVWEMIKISFPIGVVNVSSYFFSSIQVPLIAVVLGPRDVAPFYVAQRVVLFISSALLQFAIPVLPSFTTSLGNGFLLEARNSMMAICRWVAVGAFFGFFIFFCGLGLLSKLFFHIEPIEQSIALWISVDFFVMTASVVWGHFVLASGKNPFLISCLVTGVLNLVFLKLFIGQYGLLGVPISSFFAGLLASYWYDFYCGFSLLKKLNELDS